MRELSVIKVEIEDTDGVSAESIAQALDGFASSVDGENGTYEIAYDSSAQDEAEALWLLLCELGAKFPEAVVTG